MISVTAGVHAGIRDRRLSAGLRGRARPRTPMPAGRPALSHPLCTGAEPSCVCFGIDEHGAVILWRDEI